MDETGSRVSGESDGRAAPVEPCPACGGATAQVKCKTVCTRCRRLIENCSGD